MAFGFLCWFENQDGKSMGGVFAADGSGNAIMLLRFLVVYCTRKPVFFVSQHRTKAKMYLVSELFFGGGCPFALPHVCRTMEESHVWNIAEGERSLRLIIIKAHNAHSGSATMKKL
jgi:hypothetical protein